MNWKSNHELYVIHYSRSEFWFRFQRDDRYGNFALRERSRMNHNDPHFLRWYHFPVLF